MNIVKNRLELLRKAMIENGISAYIVPGTDPHASEYIADHWKEREWISGFTGSAGTVVITTDKAGLWTDSRYFLQAGIQLEGSGMDLMKLGMPDTLSINKWLASELTAGSKVAVNPLMFSVNGYSALQSELKTFKIDVTSANLINEIWTDRAPLPHNPLFAFGVEYSGKSTTEKLDMLRNEMTKLNADFFILSALDDIAWLFNVRGNDVEYNPVVISYAIASKESATLFVDPEKLTKETTKTLQNQGVIIENYESIYAAIANIDKNANVLIDGSKLNQSLFEKIPSTCTIKSSLSPVMYLKSIKNDTEIAGVKNTMIKDGVALTRFFIWLEENLKSGKVTELSASDKLREFRSQQPLFMGESFETIAGYADHGAIVHYSATPESDVALHADSIFLLDSGGQYMDGTTDITRTVALGTPTVQQKNDFTLVLKGHIALATAIFPVGTRGSQLDILARKALWDNKLNYGHGTGHGIGHFLNVHEGPQSIRMEENPVTLQPGMMISNEPGLYRTGKHGIRTENLIRVQSLDDTEFGSFLCFETLTLFPIDKILIDIELLNESEIKWINNYHKTVYDKLSPNLDENEREWLSNKCSGIK